MNAVFKSVWNEPRAPGASGPQWHDWVFVLLVLALSGVELAMRAEDIVWLPFSLALNTLFALVLPWRRLLGVYLIFLVIGLNTIAQQYSIYLGIQWDAMYTGVLILVLPFAVVRWASGKDAVIGVGFMLLSFLLSIVTNGPPWGEIAGAMLFMLFPTSLGLFLRYQAVSQIRANEQIRLLERERLARDLHDTVGHYMSAIAVQAQAGRSLAQSNPEAPLETLAVIENASRNALAEMRSILRTMRDDEAADYQPAGSLEDVRQLAENMSYPFEINVDAPDEMPGVDGVLASTLYRLTQESITNAARHGRDVRRLNVTIKGVGNDVMLMIGNDGAAVGGTHTPGLGLLGMKERVALLGGEFDAGPEADGGWLVRARLPMLGAER